MFQVIVPSADLNLLGIEELRVAVGLSADDDSQDEKLEALGARVSSMITAACRVVSDGVNPPTLLYEEYIETMRLDSSREYLYLSRRPIGAVTSVTEAGSILTPDVDYEVEYAAGRILRLCGDAAANWRCGKIVVAYDGGYESVPEDLKAIAAQLAGGYWADDGVDPMEKRLVIPGVIERERWVDAAANGQMPAEIYDALLAGGYVNRLMVL